MKRIAVLAALCLVVRSSFAAPPPGADPNSEVYKWFERQQNIRDQGCCGEGDGHRLNDNQWRVVGSDYEVLIEGTWYKIARWQLLKRVLEDPNPTGAAVVWYSYDREEVGGVKIWCFAPGWTS